MAGEFKHGKSSLVNALVGRPLCPVDDDIATAVATAVAYGPEPSATAIVLDGSGDDGDLRAEPIDVASLPAWVTERGEELAAHDVQLLDVRVPADALRDGLVVVDLPGLGGLRSVHGALTRASLPSAHAVLFVTDSAEEVTASELEALQAMSGRCELVALVESKVDIQPAWRRVAAADETTVAGLVSAVFPVSSELARQARERADQAMVAESGVDSVAAWLQEDVVGGAARRNAAVVADVVADVAAQLRQPFEAELGALARPGATTSLERLGAEVTRARSAASRWQTALADAFADLSTDVDYHLRSRLRDLLRTSEETLDALDPAKSWDSFEPQLRRQLAQLIDEHYTALEARLAEAAHAVAVVLLEDADALDTMVREATRPSGADERPTATPGDAVKAPNARRPGLGAQALTLFRSSYGGAAMTGFVATAIGFPVAAPAMLAVGIALGSKALRQESERLLLQRRAQAKAAVRTHVDQISFVVNKDSRDRIRRAQRQLRDFFGQRADERSRSAAEALEAARAAAQRDASEREARELDLRAELDRLAWLAQAAAEARAALADGQGE